MSQWVLRGRTRRTRVRLLVLLGLVLAATPSCGSDGGDTSPAADVGASSSDVTRGEVTVPDVPLPDGVALQFCTLPEECPEGRGCVEGVCAPCTSGSQCRSSWFEGCVDGTCGYCAAAEQCAEGLGCRAASGECNTCRIAAECRAGQSCADGVCAGCRARAAPSAQHPHAAGCDTFTPTTYDG